MILSILGKNIRINLHRRADETLEPVLALYPNPSNKDFILYGFGAVIHKPAVIYYSARNERGFGESWIEAEDIEISDKTIPEPIRSKFFIHTNTNNAKSNQKPSAKGLTEISCLFYHSEKNAMPQRNFLIRSKLPVPA